MTESDAESYLNESRVAVVECRARGSAWDKWKVAFALRCQSLERLLIRLREKKPEHQDGVAGTISSGVG